MKRQLSFAAGSAVELSLLLVAAGAAWALKAPLFADLHWSVRDLFLGIAATGPILFGFVLLMKATLPALAEFKPSWKPASVQPCVIGRYRKSP
jgi:hypothetical protein